MEEIALRRMRPDDWEEVATLIHLSTNHWYQASGKGSVFACSPADCEVYCRTYEALDPGCCVVAESRSRPESVRGGRIVGSCFYHPRPTHLSLGIVNVHPSWFGRGIARRMLDEVIALAEADGLPLRLVSSAMNLDSFSLYTRAGFTPRTAFQDMALSVPEAGLGPVSPNVRPATPEDVPAMAALERELVGIEREKDYRHFLSNADGIWHTSVWEDEQGIRGFLASVNTPASHMLGPGVAADEDIALALILAELDRCRGRAPVFLVPVEASGLVARLYALGAKNLEIHFAQVRGAWTRPRGVVMPTFLPETG